MPVVKPHTITHQLHMDYANRMDNMDHIFMSECCHPLILCEIMCYESEALVVS